MQAETITAPTGESTEAGPDNGAAESSSSQPSQSAGSRFFGSLVRGFRASDDPQSELARAKGEQSSEQTEESGDDAKSKGEDKSKPEGEAAKPAEGEQPFKVYATQEEHERAVQAEVDRRERVREDRAVAQRAREDHANLRRTDPEAAVAKEDEIAAQDAANLTLASSVVDTYDNELLVPLLSKLPDEKRAEVVASINSLPARRAAMDTILKHIEEDAFNRGKAEGEKKARTNPVLVKEALRDRRVAADDPPELVEAGGSSASRPKGNDAVNAFLRRGAGVR